MFTQATIAAMLALSAADATATAADRAQFRSFVIGDERDSVQGVLTFVEAARRLGAKNPQFARHLAKSGKIKSVYGTGSRPMGVTADSVNAYIEKGGDVPASFFATCGCKHPRKKDRAPACRKTKPVRTRKAR